MYFITYVRDGSIAYLLVGEKSSLLCLVQLIMNINELHRLLHFKKNLACPACEQAGGNSLTVFY